MNCQRKLPSILTPFLLAIAAGCASSSGTAEGEGVADSRTRASSECIFNFGIRDFSTLDDRNLILYGPGRRAYHVELTTPSMSLEREISIGIYDRDGDDRICPYGGDSVIIDGPFMERIPIRSIAALDDAGVEALLVQYGKAEAAEDAVTVTEIE